MAPIRSKEKKMVMKSVELSRNRGTRYFFRIPQEWSWLAVSTIPLENSVEEVVKGPESFAYLKESRPVTPIAQRGADSLPYANHRFLFY